MKVDLILITPDAEKHIEKIGRVCYDSERFMNELSAPKFIKNLISRGHDSVLEHAQATFYIDEVSRVCANQLVRHRIGSSYCQRSQRYCKEGNFNFYMPTSIASNTEASIRYTLTMDHLQKVYNELISLGCKPEDARMVLPNACHTQISVTMNFRALRNFFELRCDDHAQEEIRTMAKEMLKIMYKEAPSCFEDLNYKFIDPRLRG